jgi:hypothetical protein
MLDEWTMKDPLTRFQKVLLERGAASEKDIRDIDKKSKEYAAAEADLAVDEPMPDPATLTRGVYAGDDFAVPRLEFVKSPFRSGGAHLSSREWKDLAKDPAKDLAKDPH